MFSRRSLFAHQTKANSVSTTNTTKPKICLNADATSSAWRRKLHSIFQLIIVLRAERTNAVRTVINIPTMHKPRTVICCSSHIRCSNDITGAFYQSKWCEECSQITLSAESRRSCTSQAGYLGPGASGE